MKKKKISIPAVWMTVYSDLITNLTLFFMMLFASVLIAISKGYSEEEFREYMLKGITTGVYSEAPKKQSYLKTGEKFSKIEGVSGVRVGDQELRIVLPEPVLFDEGLAKIKDSGRETLNEVGKILGSGKYMVTVEGHTCDLPIIQTPPKGKKRWQLAMERSTGLGPYYSNRELSGARALQVLRFLVKEKLIAPERISVSAYGPAVPLVPNIDESGRKKNRRVELKIVLYGGSRL